MPIADPTPHSSVVYRSKQAILHVAGNTVYDPAKLADSYAMEQFAFSDMQHIDLARRLTRLRQEDHPGSPDILPKKVAGCDTVGDCVQLVIT